MQPAEVPTPLNLFFLMRKIPLPFRSLSTCQFLAPLENQVDRRHTMKIYFIRAYLDSYDHPPLFHGGIEELNARNNLLAVG